MRALTIGTVHEVLGMSELHIQNANIRMRSGFRLSVPFNSIQFSIQKKIIRIQFKKIIQSEKNARIQLNKIFNSKLFWANSIQ